MRFIQLIAFLTCAFSSFADVTPTQVILNSSDSRQLFDAIKGVDKVEWYKKLHHNKLIDIRRDIKIFQTSDAAIGINCTAELFIGTMINHTCVISFDKSKSSSDNIIEERAPGLLYGFIHHSSDTISLFERILKPHPSFTSFEKLPVQKNDGTTVEWFRLLIHCSLENVGLI